MERGNDDYYQTQYKLLKSEALLKTVYKRLNLEVVPEYAGVYGYRRLMGPIVIAPVPPLSPIKPRKMFNMLLSLIGGLVLGLFAAVLVEFIDQGVVPLTPFPKKQVAYNHLLLQEHSLIAESIRNLRTMVDFAEVAQKSKSFMVTSSVQGEGKSYMAGNLAVAIAQTGEKVLIIDGDLRRSTIHKVFRVSNAKGLSDYLAGGRNIEDAKALIQESDVKGLSILVGGPRPPNPAELLNTPRLEAFINWATQEYDRVIVDCPPMFPISDALLWGKCIPGCVYVVNFGKTRVPLIKTATKRMAAASIKILGTIVNMSKFGGLSYSYYGYYQYKYNYHYGYNYAPDEPEKPETPDTPETPVTKTEANKELV